MKNIKFYLFFLFIFNNGIYSGIESILREIFKHNFEIATFRENYLYSTREAIRKNNNTNMPEDKDKFNEVSYLYQIKSEQYKDINTAMMGGSFIFLLIAAKRFFKVSSNIYKNLKTPDEIFKKDFKKVINYEYLKFFIHRFKQRHPFSTNLYRSFKNVFTRIYGSIYSLYSDKNFNKYYQNIFINKELEDNYLIENKDNLLEYKDNYLERINNIIKNNFNKYNIMKNNFILENSLGISQEGIDKSLGFIKLAFQGDEDKIKELIYGKNYKLLLEEKEYLEDDNLEAKEGLKDNKNKLIKNNLIFNQEEVYQKNKNGYLLDSFFKANSKITSNRLKRYINNAFYSDKSEYIKTKINNYPLYNKDYIISAIIFIAAAKIFLYFYNNLKEIEIEERFVQLNEDDIKNKNIRIIGINDIESGNYSKLVEKILIEEDYEKITGNVNATIEILLSGSAISFFYSTILRPNLNRFDFSGTGFTKKFLYKKFFSKESAFRDFIIGTYQNSKIKKGIILFPIIAFSSFLKPFLTREILRIIGYNTKNNSDIIKNQISELYEKNIQNGKKIFNMLKDETTDFGEKIKNVSDKDGKIEYKKVIETYFFNVLKILDIEKKKEE